MKNIIQSDLVVLRNTQETDLDFVIQAEQNPENAQYVGQWSIEQHRCALANKDILHLIIQDIAADMPVGYVIMAGLDNPNDSLEVRRIVICKKGKGFGRDTLRLIKQIAFEQVNAHRLWLDVRFKNQRAQELYKSEGFKEEGILRDCILYNGSYESLIVMSVLVNEYDGGKIL